MKCRVLATLVAVVGLASCAWAQLDHIVIAAGTPEDQALQASSKETDPEKKLALYQDFVEKFASNPAAVAYGNWQISQYYQNAGDLAKALEYGDKALAGSPRNLDILVSQAGIAQQMKNDEKIMDYAEKGGIAYEGISKAPKPEGMSDTDYAARVLSEKESARPGTASWKAWRSTRLRTRKMPRGACPISSGFQRPFPTRSFRKRSRNMRCTRWGPAS